MQAASTGLILSKRVKYATTRWEVKWLRATPVNLKITTQTERPIMHYKTLLLLCDDERCGKAGKIDKASHLREILKEMGLNKGKNRIKISRTGCYGACRFRQVCQITENTQANGNPKNNAIWLRHTHNFTDKQWKELFVMLSEDKILLEELDAKYFIPMKVYE